MIQNNKNTLPASLSILGLLGALPPFEFELAAILRFFSSTYNNKDKIIKITLKKN